MLKELYPEINIFDHFILKTESSHNVYVEQAGNRSGIPILFLHGGPGSGCNENHRRYFNPEKYRSEINDMICWFNNAKQNIFFFDRNFYTMKKFQSQNFE